ncbi:MAG: metallophosphoesterase [Myxococcales bacterium]|nr:metallophosphoesterase [Myxococcales bacterium]
MIEIVELEGEPVAGLPYLNAARGGGTERRTLVVERARVRGLPPDLDAVIATSDLQGIVIEPHTRASILLGVATAELLAELAFDGVLPAADHTGVVLAGDLYSVPAANKRGGHGEVAPVWAAFAESFAWVAGVAGNHDDVSTVRRAPHVHVLDTDLIDRGGLRIGGVGLIAGNPAKRGRRAEDDQLERIEVIATSDLDLLLLHEGPGGDDDQPGHPLIRAVVERARVPLTICGHVHWDRPLARHTGGQILNVDTRVLVLVPA